MRGVRESGEVVFFPCKSVSCSITGLQPDDDQTLNPNLQTLQAQLREINIKLAEVKNSEKPAALAAIKEQVALYGISEEELLKACGFLKVKRKKAAAKYYDPSTGKTWSGHGARPKWLEGKSLEDYLVDRAPKPWWPEKEA